MTQIELIIFEVITAWLAQTFKSSCGWSRVFIWRKRIIEVYLNISQNSTRNKFGKRFSFWILNSSVVFQFKYLSFSTVLTVSRNSYYNITPKSTTMTNYHQKNELDKEAQSIYADFIPSLDPRIWFSGRRRLKKFELAKILHRPCRLLDLKQVQLIQPLSLVQLVYLYDCMSYFQTFLRLTLD